MCALHYPSSSSKMTTTIIDFWKENRSFWITPPSKQKEVDKLATYVSELPQTEIAMIIPEAISILKIHQQWRLGADIVMIEPKELTKAIDVLINYHIDIMNETLSSQTEIKFTEEQWAVIWDNI